MDTHATPRHSTQPETVTEGKRIKHSSGVVLRGGSDGRFPLTFDLTGKRFHRFLVVANAGGGQWRCVCDCGSARVRSGWQLRHGRALSCGCLRTEQKQKRDAKFGRFAQERRPLSAEALRSALHYEPSTGVFTWIAPTAKRTKVGDVAGRSNSAGYWSIHIGGRSYPAHHVAWLYVFGVWPTDKIDHKNLNRCDNRIENLREATAAQNRHNTSVFRNNTSGFKGVHRASKNRWGAEIMVDRRAIWLGSFKTPEEASEAYVAAKRQHHCHFIEGQGVRRD